MTFLKKVAAVAVMASAGVAGTAGFASAATNDSWQNTDHHALGDNGVAQGGLIPINTLQTVNISPNFGCLLDQTFPDLTAQGLVGVVPIGANLSHVLEHANLNVLSNGNVTTETYDYSCTSNQGSSQAGNNSHGSVGAGDSTSTHTAGEGAGSHNDGAGAGSGGLLGATGLVGRGGLDLTPAP